MSYETGVALAFFWWIASAAWLIVIINSQYARNLRRVGMRLSLASLEPHVMTREEYRAGGLNTLLRFIGAVMLKLPLIFLSWVYLAYLLGLFLYTRHKTAGAPPAIKEFEWKLKNLDLEFEQIAQGLYDINVAVGSEKREYSVFRAELVQILKPR